MAVSAAALDANTSYFKNVNVASNLTVVNRVDLPAGQVMTNPVFITSASITNSGNPTLNFNGAGSSLDTINFKYDGSSRWQIISIAALFEIYGINYGPALLSIDSNTGYVTLYRNLNALGITLTGGNLDLGNGNINNIGIITGTGASSLTAFDNVNANSITGQTIYGGAGAFVVDLSGNVTALTYGPASAMPPLGYLTNTTSLFTNLNASLTGMANIAELKITGREFNGITNVTGSYTQTTNDLSIRYSGVGGHVITWLAPSFWTNGQTSVSFTCFNVSAGHVTNVLAGNVGTWGLTGSLTNQDVGPGTSYTYTIYPGTSQVMFK